MNPFVLGASPLGDIIQAAREEIGVFMGIGIYDNFGSGSGHVRVGSPRPTRSSCVSGRSRA